MKAQKILVNMLVFGWCCKVKTIWCLMSVMYGMRAASGGGSSTCHQEAKRIMQECFFLWVFYAWTTAQKLSLTLTLSFSPQWIISVNAFSVSPRCHQVDIIDLCYLYYYFLIQSVCICIYYTYNMFTFYFNASFIDNFFNFKIPKHFHSFYCHSWLLVLLLCIQ